MNIFEVCFWLCIACIVYTYALYPLLMALIAGQKSPAISSPGRFAGSVSILIPAYNEASCIIRRIDEFSAMLAATGLDGEIIVISDGSTDRTADLAKERSSLGVQVLELPENAGKAEALAHGSAAARGEVIVLADARQRWAPDALESLLQNFTDPAVGGVSGDLSIDSGPGMLSGVGRYWQYEKWIRRNESMCHSTVGVTGAISAVRSALFPRIPRGTVLDDVYWPMRVVLSGYRVVHDQRAIAYDRLPDKANDEFKRKLRTLTGNFQLVALLPALLVPRRNPIWFQFVSHKIMRLLVPWALLALFAVSIMLPQPIYRLALLAQMAFYGLGLAGILLPGRSRLPLASTAGSFIMLNAAAFLACWAWFLGGKSTDYWHKAAYHEAEAVRTGYNSRDTAKR